MTKTTTYYSNQLNETFINELNVSLKVKDNPYQFNLGSLFQMAARKNPKRNFLFVSKLLGKHIPVPPQIPLINGLLLADLLLKELNQKSPFNTELLKKAIENYDYIPEASMELQKKIDLSNPTLFLGFAETATGLGHAMFHSFVDNAEYIHTTRENIISMKSSFDFEEEHSHATSHSCFSKEKNYFEKFNRIVLIDDEITTGNTALNLIKALNTHFPNKEYIVASILDWRNDSEIDNFKILEKKLNIKIKVLSLVSGQMTYTKNEFSFEEANYSPLQNDKTEVKTVYLPLNEENKLFEETLNENQDLTTKLYTYINGRFGLKGKDNANNEDIIKRFAEIIKKEQKFDNSLVVGSGEFMFIPAWIASYLNGNVQYYSSTRSPIYAINRDDYPIKNAIKFNNPENKSINNYLYNITPNTYKEVIFILERDIDDNSKKYLSEKLIKLGIANIVFAVLQ